MLETIKTFALLRELRSNTRLSPKNLKNLQDRLLLVAVRNAYRNLPFYKDHWNRSGFDVRKFRGIEDLRKIPITTPIMAKQAARKGALTSRTADRKKCTYLDSSGSSGEPLRVLKQPSEERLRRAVGLRILFEHGFRWHHRTVQFQILSGPSHPLQRFGIGRKIWISTAQPIQAQLSRLIESKADVLVGTPTALRNMANAIESAGAHLRQPAMVFCAGELVDLETKAVVKRIFNTSPIALYGQTEMGYIAWQCEQKQHFHINADTHLVEIIKQGRPARAGELGTMVITDLRARTMPFLRYNTGDLAISHPDACPCGRQLPLIGSIEGREKDSFQLEGGQLITPRVLIDQLTGALPLGQYRLSQSDKHRFCIEIASQFFKGEKGRHQSLSACREIILDRLRPLFGEMAVSIKTVTPWKQDGTGKTHTIVSAPSFGEKSSHE